MRAAKFDSLTFLANIIVVIAKIADFSHSNIAICLKIRNFVAD